MSGYNASTYKCVVCHNREKCYIDQDYKTFICSTCVGKYSNVERVMLHYEALHTQEDFDDLKNGCYQSRQWPHASNPKSNAEYQAQFERHLREAKEQDQGTYWKRIAEHSYNHCNGTAYCQCHSCRSDESDFEYDDDPMKERYFPPTDHIDTDYPPIDQWFNKNKYDVEDTDRPLSFDEELSKSSNPISFSAREDWMDGIERMLEDIWEEQDPEEWD